MVEERGPVISRSKIQLATSYSPGTLFTFEGGRGCFLSVPVPTKQYTSSIGNIVQRQIEEQMKEYVMNWFTAGMACRGAAGPPVYEKQVLHNAFLDHRYQPAIDMGHFLLVEPQQVAYCPEPLVFCCRACGLLCKYKDINDFYDGLQSQQNRNDCKEIQGGRHDWAQLDVLFAHWSGNYEPLYPESPCTCGNNEYYLKKSSTGVFSDWYFKCSSPGCPTRRDLARRDPITKPLLEEKMREGAAHQIKEMMMLPISYRASSLHYTHTERFIPYHDSSIFELLQPGRQAELAGQLLEIYGYPHSPLTDGQIEEALRICGQGSVYSAYQSMKKLSQDLKDRGQKATAAAIDVQINNMLDGWERQGLISRSVSVPKALAERVASRASYVRRYDPIRLGVEHAKLQERHLNSLGGMRSSAVDLLTPSADIAPEGTESGERKAAYQAQLRTLLGRLGVKRLILIRDLDLVQYSFGYTRVAATPTTVQKNMAMPVRLCAFDHIEKGKRPIYVLHQKNEAFYVMLDSFIVIRWLEVNGVSQGLQFQAGQKFGARYIEEYIDFGAYLDNYKRRDQSVPRTICNMTYLLLHTMAHQFIHAVSEYSGLEASSLGEYVFPADLSFLIYRCGMTPDLGNLSSMWRNFHCGVLEQMMSASKLLCSSGSLCDHRGGACPGCIMVPETTCIAGNYFLSRSALKGGPAPLWSQDKSDLLGFFRLCGDAAVR